MNENSPIHPEPDSAHAPRDVVLATMHHKERAIRPAFARLNITLTVPEGLDTDQFGSFSGEIPRHGSMIDAARAKLDAAFALTRHTVGVVSEGTYGPDAGVPFAATGFELMLWHDRSTGHTVHETLTDYEPTYRHIHVAFADELTPFLTHIGFPAQAVMIAPRDGDLSHTRKGLREPDAVHDAIRHAVAVSPRNEATVTTDMRAHMNTRRMHTIGVLAHKLVDRLAHACSHCQAPGWGVIERIAGLACQVCDTPTHAVRFEVYGCTLCGARETRPRTDGVTTADPSQCPTCNP